MSYPPQAPQQQGYYGHPQQPQQPQQGGYYPQQQQPGQAYPPQQSAYPPQQPAYPPQQPAYPPQQPSYGATSPGKAYGSAPAPTAAYPPGYDQAAASSSAAALVAPPAEENRFAPPSGPQDLWAAILFLAHLAGVAAIAGLTIPKVDFKTMKLKSAATTTTSSGKLNSLRSSTSSSSSSTMDVSFQFDTAAITAMAGSAVVALAFSFLYLLAMRRFPKGLIKFTYWLSVAFYLVAGIASIVLAKNIISGVLCLLMAGLFIYFYSAYKSRFPFAAVMMATVAEVTQKYTATVFLGLVALIVNLAYTVFFVITLLSSSMVWGNVGTGSSSSSSSSSSSGNNTNNNKLSGAAYALWVFLTFSFYWTSQVIVNVLHVTIAGVFGSYYFMSGTAQGMPSSPTVGAFTRAITTSFGSICFGSLIIALIQTVQAVLRQLMNDTDSAIAAFIICCVQCLLSWIEAWAEIFNKYAFCQVAIYGKPFVRAAKDTWTMIKDRGVDALINDSLIGNVLGLGAVLVGGITVLVAWAIFAVGRTTVVPSGSFDLTLLIVLVVAFFVGVVMFSLISTVVSSGVATTFVALAEDPAALAHSKPELWEKIRETYPDAAFTNMYH
ncbi:plasma-membrane choline transporter-domain-containing protein [Blastocladiella britannica]|nr:plasma-membrane choline transporter-domain-containing protein [Blastocladiella britannica]